MNIKLTHHNHLSRKRKIIKARRKAKNLWSEKRKNLLANGYHALSKMLKLGTHLFSKSKKDHDALYESTMKKNHE